jgi:hypothetical protein
MVAVIAAGMLALCGAQEAQKGDDPVLDRHRDEIVTDISQAEDYLAKLRLQDVRSKIELINLKLGQAKSKLPAGEYAMFKGKADAVSSRAAAKQDSLVKVPFAILYAKGPDEALAYIQNELRKFGVNEQKVDSLEKKIFLEGPKVRQEIERRALERTIKALNNGQSPEPGLDPYILAAAKRAVKAHADSILAAENEKKRKLDEEKKRQELLLAQKLAKEKKLEEEKAAKLRAEQEKKRLAEAEIVRRKAEAAEKAHRDSIATVRRDSLARVAKIQQEIAFQEKERQRRLDELKQEQARRAKAKEDSVKQAQALKLSLLEKARNDSLAAIRRDSMAAAQKIQQERAEKEKERVRVLLEEQKKQEAAEAAEQNRKRLAQQAKADSLAALQRQHEQEIKEHQDKQDTLDKAQAMTLELYDMLDKNQGKKALDKFQQERIFLLATIEREAYDALEHAIISAAIQELTRPLPESKRTRQDALASARKSLDKINGLARDHKIEAVYTEFKFTEHTLSGYMAKSDFLLLKSLIEGAYKDRKRLLGNVP